MKKILTLLIIIMLLCASLCMAGTIIKSSSGDSISFPPPENFIASDGYLCIDLEWDPPQTDIHTKIPTDPILQGYTLYRDDIGFMYYFNDPTIDSYTDRMVECWGEYIYTLYAIYDLGTSQPVSDTAIAYPPTGGYHEAFDADWRVTGWNVLGHPNNWLWSPGNAYLHWDPTVEDYDMSLISPEIFFPFDPLNIFDLVVSMYIDDYAEDFGEVMEIWVIHDTGEDMIFEWDLDEYDDWGISGGTDWTYEEMYQYAGQNIQFKFRSHGGSTYNFNNWYIYNVISNWCWVPLEYGTLEGIVTDYDGNPIPYVCVSTLYGDVYTDENGHYMASPFPVGIYDIPFYHDDYAVQWYYDVEICSGDTTILNATLGNPTMEITPDSLYVELPMYCSTTRTLTLTNNGDIPLEWYISYWDKNAHQYKPDKFKTKDNSSNIYAEYDPNAEVHSPPSSDEIWDIMFNYDVETPSGGIGLAGAEFGNGYFLVSEWGYSSTNVFKFDVEGNYIGSWNPLMDRFIRSS